MEQRPVAIKVIGIAWIILGLLWIQTWFMTQAISGMSGGSQPSLFGPEWFGLAVTFQAAMGAVGLVAGIGLLRLWRWARVALIALSGILLVYTIGIGVMLIFMAINTAASGIIMLAGGMVGVSLFTMAAMGVPTFLTLRALTRQDVREAFAAPA